MSSSPILRARRTVSRPMRVAGVFRLGEPAGFLNRLAAALIDCLVVAPFGVVVLLAAVAISRATGGEVQLHPAFGALLLLLVHWTHALVLEGGPRGGTLGKQFLGLQVCDGESGEVAGHGPALARHLCLELWCLGSVCASFLLTARRQTGYFESLDVYESIDWMVFVGFALAFVAPVFGYRAMADARQWPHDRIAGTVVVSLATRIAPIVQRQVLEPDAADAAPLLGSRSGREQMAHKLQANVAEAPPLERRPGRGQAPVSLLGGYVPSGDPDPSSPGQPGRSELPSDSEEADADSEFDADDSADA